MRSSHYLLIAVFLFLYASRLVQEGMLPDGVSYAAISNNLAHGIGSFWAPKFSDTLFPVFYEVPPLMFGLQSLFFKVLGDGYGTERIYCFVVAVLTLVILARLWLSFFRNTGLEKWWPVPLFLWMVNQDAYLGYTGNIPGCTMTLFDLLAVLILLIKWPLNNIEGSNKPAWIFLTGAGLALIAAFLTNGPAGLYPLAFFAIAGWGNDRSIGATAKYTLGLTAIVAGILGFFFLFDAPSQALIACLEQPVSGILQEQNIENIGTHRFAVFQRVVETQFHWLITGGLLWYFLIKRKGKIRINIAQKPMLFAALMTAAALFFMLLSPKQSTHNILPALPWIAMALGAWFSSITGEIKTFHSSPVVLKIASFVLMLAATGFVMVNTGKTIPGNAEVLGDVKELMKVLPAGGTIAYTDNDLPVSVNGYFQRYNYTAIDHEMKQHKYWMVTKGRPVADTVPQFYQIIRLDTRLYDVYMKR